MNREEQAAQLAPISPPCFNSRDQWLEYVRSAASAQRDKHAAGPLLFRKGQPVTFNRELFFCADCSAKHADAMSLVNRCKPNYLMRLPELIAAATARPRELAEDEC